MDDGLTEPSENRYLKNPLSISDLITDGAHFEINTDFDGDIAKGMLEELNLGSDIDDDGDDDEKNPLNRDILISPWTKPFAELKLHMIPVNDYIYKRITKNGHADGGLVPINARACIRYNAYWESETAPFDSSFLRDSTFSFYTGRHEVIVGLEDAIRTMSRGEHAQFLISYELLFGEMGCPPRIKPRADGLYIIELVAFNVVGDMNATENLNEEDRKKFSTVIEKVKDVHFKGIDFFKQGMYKNAIGTFERAVKVLELCNLSNDEEEEAQTSYLITLYTNLALCYLKVKQPKKTCIMCKQINYLSKGKPSCKAFFQEGRALHMLGEFERASVLLKKAQNMEPQNKAISDELKILEERFSRYKSHEKRFWSNALGVKKIVEKPTTGSNNENHDEFVRDMTQLIKTFKDSDDNNDFKLPEGLTELEISEVAELARNMNVNFSVMHLDNPVYVLRK